MFIFSFKSKKFKSVLVTGLLSIFVVGSSSAGWFSNAAKRVKNCASSAKNYTSQNIVTKENAKRALWVGVAATGAYGAYKNDKRFIWAAGVVAGTYTISNINSVIDSSKTVTGGLASIIGSDGDSSESGTIKGTIKNLNETAGQVREDVKGGLASIIGSDEGVSQQEGTLRRTIHDLNGTMDNVRKDFTKALESVVGSDDNVEGQEGTLRRTIYDLNGALGRLSNLIDDKEESEDSAEQSQDGTIRGLFQDVQKEIHQLSGKVNEFLGSDENLGEGSLRAVLGNLNTTVNRLLVGDENSQEGSVSDVIKDLDKETKKTLKEIRVFMRRYRKILPPDPEDLYSDDEDVDKWNERSREARKRKKEEAEPVKIQSSLPGGISSEGSPQTWGDVGRNLPGIGRFFGKSTLDDKKED